MELFVLSTHCLSKVHCDLCRSKVNGKFWREKLSERYELPDNNIDFTCPYGKLWDTETIKNNIENPQGVNLGNIVKNNITVQVPVKKKCNCSRS
jgi:hypothetical protein